VNGETLESIIQPRRLKLINPPNFDKIITQNKEKMRRAAVFLLLVSWQVHAVLAAPCYGTDMPDKYKSIIGLQEDVMDRKPLKADYGQLDSRQHFFLWTYAFTDWFCFDGKIGMGDVKHYSPYQDNLYYKKGFSGGYGFRIKVYDEGKNRLVFGFQHISVHPFEVKIDDVRHKAILDDWQFSFLASHDFSMITPYAGIKAERADYIRWIGKAGARNRGDMDKSLSLVTGADFPINKKVSLNLEGQFFNGKSGSAAVKYKF
jgi:hypothetical protein